MEAEQKEVTIEEIVAKGAKRLDRVLAKYGKSNGIVNVRNFNVVGRKTVYLQGSELAKVGTGYSAEGKTVQEQVDSLIEQIEADCEASASREPKAKKVEAPKAPATPAVSTEGGEGEDQKGGEGEEDEKEEGGEGEGEGEGNAPEPEFTKKQLEAICKKRGIKIPRGADKKVLAALIEKDQAGK